MSALISFLGGSAFRMVWGEVSSYFNKRQDHQHEMERMKAQDDADMKRHERDTARIRLQADLGVREIQVVGDVEMQKTEASAWLQAVQDVGRQTGIKFIDIWNGSIRPLLATLAITVVVAEIIVRGWQLDDWDKELVAAILGIYVADRSLHKRGK